MPGDVLLLACGALARELVELCRRNDWQHVRIQCLPADLHNTPERIPDAVAAAIERYRDDCQSIFVAYADCGTGGRLDRVLERYGVERIPGAHCYEFYAGEETFGALSSEEPGTFYLTDFLARHFERLVVRGLGLDRHPELKSQYFGNYRRVVYLAQTDDEALTAAARAQADFLGLAFERRYTGLQPVDTVIREKAIAWRN